MHLVYPPKLCITIVFDFSWDDCNTLESLETMVMQNSEGENKVHYGPYESNDYKRCKVCLKLSYLTDNPGVVRGCVNEDYATGQRVVCEQALCLGKKNTPLDQRPVHRLANATRSGGSTETP